MASDWVKMRGVLLKHQKTARMARFLAEREDFRRWMFITPPEEPTLKIVPREVIIRLVVTGLLGLWDTANATISDDDILSHTEVDDLDLMAGIPGFGEAICDAGWAENVTDGDESVTKSDEISVTHAVTPSVMPRIRLPNFIEFNTPDRDRKPAKSGAERQAEYRDRRKSNKSDESVTKSVTKSDGPIVTEVTKSDADREIDRRDREIDRKKDTTPTPTPPTPSPDTRKEKAAVAMAGDSVNSGEENPEVAAFAEWRKLEVELRNLGMVATDEPIQNLQVQGLKPDDGWEIVAYWKSKPRDYWPDMVKALRSKLNRAIEGEAVDSAWLEPSKRYTDADRADRGEEERQRRIREAEAAEQSRTPQQPTASQSSGKSGKDLSAELEPLYGATLDAMSDDERDSLAIPIWGDPGSFHFQLYRKNWKKPGDHTRRLLMQEIAKRSSAGV